MKWKKGFQSIGNWFFYTVLFAILPLATYFLICWLYKLDYNVTGQYLSELCAFNMVIVSSIMTDIASGKCPYIKKGKLYFTILLLIVIFFVVYAIIYAGLLDGQIGLEELKRPLFLMKIFSGIYFIIALLLHFLGGSYEC